MKPDNRHHADIVQAEGLFRWIRHALPWIGYSPFIIGLLSLVWLAFRTGTKPSRAAYPCQQAAAAQSSLWLATFIFPLITVVKHRVRWTKLRAVLLVIVLLSLLVWGTDRWVGGPASLASQPQSIGLNLQGRLATQNPASDIFAVNGTTGNDGGLVSLIGLMGTQGRPFYQSSLSGKRQGPDGLIAVDDTLIIKVNSQWDERGGTNTDLVKSLIEAITRHPDGFGGEIIVADNGQGQYGLNGSGGSLDYARNNAEDVAQSVQKVVDSFTGVYRVSTFLWDNITTRKVAEYSEGDLENGYVLNPSADSPTGIIISYPKFKTRYGTFISFKKGVWHTQTVSYNDSNLKVINVPVLKSHAIYGVTASLKHYMGVGSDKLTAQAGVRMHNTVGSGGMGTEMVETRFPALNILDAIWVNASPGRGPGTSYIAAVKTGVIAASTDPVALDYWAAKYILVQAAIRTGKNDTSSMDPDNTRARSFGQWLRLSKEEITNAGYQANTDEAKINVHVSSINQETTPLPSSDAPTTISSPVPPPVASVAQSPVLNTSQVAPPSSESSGQPPGRGWTDILVRVVVPLLVAGFFIALISYRMKKKGQ